MMQEDIQDRIKASLEEDGRITCASLHKIARDLGREPLEVGQVATALEIHASKCQLGLFGHGPKAEGKGRIVESGVEVSEELEARVRRGLVDGRLPCAVAWEIASELKLKRLYLGNAAETLGIAVWPCQLGFF